MGEKNNAVSRESERSLFSQAFKAERAVCRSLFCSPKCLRVLKKMMCVLLCSLSKHLKAQQRVFLKCNCNRNAWKTQEAETASACSVKSLEHVVQAGGGADQKSPLALAKHPSLPVQTVSCSYLCWWFGVLFADSSHTIFWRLASACGYNGHYSTVLSPLAGRESVCIHASSDTHVG